MKATIALLIALFAAFCSSLLAQTNPSMFPPSPKATNMPHHAIYPTPPPAKTNVLISWNYGPDPDVFRLRSSVDPSSPLGLWAVLTNVPGSNRSVRVPMNGPFRFYTLTASNSAGESKYATK